MKVFVFFVYVIATPVLQLEGLHQAFELKISPLKDSDRKSNVPVNPFATQCGGSGKLIGQRNSFCAHTNCTGPHPTEPVHLETDLKFSKTIEKLGWRFTACLERGEPFVNYDGPVVQEPDSPLVAETLYGFRADIIPKSEFKGLKSRVKVRYEFYDLSSKYVDICIDVKFEFI